MLPSIRPSRVRRITLFLAAALAACGDSGSGSTPVDPGDRDRPSNGLVRIDQTLISATVDGDELHVTLPVERVSAEVVETELNVELLDVGGSAALDGVVVPVKLDRTLGELTATLDLPRAIEKQADLVRFNLRIHDGSSDGLHILRSAFATIPRYEVRLEGPARIAVDKTVSYRVRAHDPKTFAALPGAEVTLELVKNDEVERTLSGKTDARGDAFFELSLGEVGDYEVRAKSGTHGTLARLSEAVAVEDGTSRLLLTTDKPIYQPGQLVHLRALALQKGSNEPVNESKVRFEILDGKGNKIFKREVRSDAYGIAATTFRLGTVLNMGTFQVHVIAGELDVQKTFEVSRYVLPKFAVDVALDKSWYRAGDTLSGTLDARYFFGKDVGGADVEITGATLDIGENAFARVMGKTTASGTYAFSLELPSSLVGLPLEQGGALVTLHVKVTDSAGQVVEKDAAVKVAAQAAQLVVVPESTVLVPGMENRLLVFATDPTGAPIANATVDLSVGSGTSERLTTDAFGQAIATVVPYEDGWIEATLLLDGGESVRVEQSFAAQSGEDHVIVRTDRAVYDVGQTVAVDIETTDHGSVYVDWLHEGQAVDQRTVQAAEGKAHFEMPLDTALAGNNRIEAYVVDDGGNVVRAGSTLFVREGGTLDVSLSTDKTTYAPGEPAQLTFEVKDEAGTPKVAALGLQIVDEAVFSLVEAKPGLLRTYFELDDAFAEPHYQIGAPAGSMAELVFEDTRAEEPDAQAAAQKRARATFAALGDAQITGIHAGSWASTITRVGALLGPTYDAQARVLEQALAQQLAAARGTRPDIPCTSFDFECTSQDETSLRASILERFRPSDPWGSAYRVTDQWSAVELVSAGPDEVQGTDDDHTLSVPFETSSGGGGGDVQNDDVAGGGWDGNDNGGDDGAGGSPTDGTGGELPDDEGGGASEPRVRRDFPETLYVNPALITGPDGRATIEVPLADSITEWRVSTLANAKDGRLGGSTHGITVFQDFFVDIAFPATLTRGDELSFPIALYNYLDTPQSVSVSLESAPWYTPLGGTSATVELGPNEVKGLSFPVRVDDVGVHTLTVKAVGDERSDAVERSVRVVPDGKAFPEAQSGALGAGDVTLSVSYPANAVEGSGELALTIYPAFLASVVSGMDSLLQEPYGCFEQTTSTTWPNVLVLRYLRDTKQLTPEIELKAEAYISAGYQRLLTFEHPGGGFSWFGTDDPAPYLSVTAFGVMEFADMAKVRDVDEAMQARTIEWLVSQQKADGTWEGDQTEFFSFHTSKVRNTAFVAWSLASAGYAGPELGKALSYLRAHYDDEKQDGYTLALVANAFAVADPSDATLDDVLEVLDTMKNTADGKVSWDAGDTQTDFYGYGNDAVVTTTALVAHALLSSGVQGDAVKGALDLLAASRDQNGNFGSTQATIWSLRTLLLAAAKGTKGAVGTLTVAVDGDVFTTLELSEDQSDVTTTIDLGSRATTGAHDVVLDFAGTGKLSYNLVSSYHLPWSEVPTANDGPLAVDVSYDRTNLAVNDTVTATVNVANQSGATANMVLVDLGIPPGFTVETDDLEPYLGNDTLSRYEVTPRQLILYITEIPEGSSATYRYRLRATMPVRASDGGAKVYPYYEPDQKSVAAATTLVADE